MSPRNDKVELRLTTLEKADWVKSAGGSRLLSQWIRGVCNAEAESTRDPSAARSDTPRVAVTVDQPEPRDEVPGRARSESCDRWRHHRPGTYCGACKEVIK